MGRIKVCPYWLALILPNGLFPFTSVSVQVQLGKQSHYKYSKNRVVNSRGNRDLSGVGRPEGGPSVVGELEKELLPTLA